MKGICEHLESGSMSCNDDRIKWHVLFALTCGKEFPNEYVARIRNKLKEKGNEVIKEKRRFVIDPDADVLTHRHYTTLYMTGEEPIYLWNGKSKCEFDF